MSDPAYANRDEYGTELIDGKIVSMSPRAAYAHSTVIMNLTLIIGPFFKGNKCTLFSDFEVILTPKDHFVPDLMIVCDKDKIKKDAVYGAPDLVIEVLSPSTEKRDRQYKKKVYEEAGVKEYWLVNTKSRSIEIYTIIDGRLELSDVHTIIPYYTVDRMTEEEKANIVYEFSPHLFPELVITSEDVFDNVIE
jgi:Uma2 family endonuclease